jgi:hypothetical protein
MIVDVEKIVSFIKPGEKAFIDGGARTCIF